MESPNPIHRHIILASSSSNNHVDTARYTHQTFAEDLWFQKHDLQNEEKFFDPNPILVFTSWFVRAKSEWVIDWQSEVLIQY